MLDTLKKIKFHTVSDSRGRITIVERGVEFDFDLNRIYYLHGVPTGSARGGHAHKNLKQIIIAVSGSFVLRLDDGITKRAFVLDDPREGVFVGPMVWRELDSFSANAVCLVMASQVFDEDDYYRDYEQFLRAVTRTK